MDAPKMRSLFRNVRTKPKQFEFRSRHLPKEREDWEKRKRKIEDEVNGVQNPGGRKIEFNRRRVSNKQASRKAMFRTLLIGVVLMYVAYRMIIWAETTEWGNLLEFIKENG